MTKFFSILAMMIMISGSAWAGSGVPMPSVPKANGEACVRDVAFMRQNHMDVLLHQRDETMHEGIRPEKENLNTCLTCHAVKDTAGHPVSYESPKHFCRTCHDYAAVRVDCFECHSSKPSSDVVQKKTNAGTNQ